MRVPKYRRRRDRDSAYVEMDGRRITLPGRHGSPESKDAYRRLLNQYLQAHATAAKPRRIRPAWEVTVADVAADWLDHCKGYYTGSATRSNEYDNCRYAVRPLVAVCGDWAVVDFDPQALKTVREAMITGAWKCENAKKPIVAWPRAHANAQVNRIKRMFRWGVEAGLVPPEVAAVVAAVAPLPKGRSTATETDPVQPVPAKSIDKTLPHLSPIVRAMVEIQRATGMRSDNLCAMRPMDIDRTGKVWIYRPPDHKGSSREKPLAVPLGPRCQKILRPYLDRPADAFCFSPREAVGRAIGRRAPGTRYTTGTYRNAVHKASVAAGVDSWHPHQLRHNAANAAKRAHGLDGARAYLGHSIIKTTEIYEERDLALACRIAREIG